jgi:hypothetical protein
LAHILIFFGSVKVGQPGTLTMLSEGKVLAWLTAITGGKQHIPKTAEVLDGTASN